MGNGKKQTGCNCSSSADLLAAAQHDSCLVFPVSVVMKHFSYSLSTTTEMI